MYFHCKEKTNIFNHFINIVEKIINKSAFIRLADLELKDSLQIVLLKMWQWKKAFTIDLVYTQEDIYTFKYFGELD